MAELPWKIVRRSKLRATRLNMEWMAKRIYEISAAYQREKLRVRELEAKRG